MELEAEAKENRRGIWSKPDDRFIAAAQTQELLELQAEMEGITTRHGSRDEEK